MIRRMMISFGPDSTPDDFTITWENSYAETNGTACISEIHDTVLPFLWIEVLAFQVAVIIVILVTAFYYVNTIVITRPRSEDLIMCRDTRHIDNNAIGRLRAYPLYHLFTQDMAELGWTKFYDDRTISTVQDPAQPGAVSAEDNTFMASQA
jgi:hypothetical protein